jgi:hypothetical protein
MIQIQRMSSNTHLFDLKNTMNCCEIFKGAMDIVWQNARKREQKRKIKKMY